jgi:alkylation response protein AidB-like acyl-CoA dehydrogenase
VNRIFEGTNEINRLLIPGMLARRAAKGDLGIIAAARALQDELLGPPSMTAGDGSLLGDEQTAVKSLKKACLLVLGLAMQTYREKIADQQEVLMHLADMIIDTYSADSAVLRALSVSAKKLPRADLQVVAARVFVNDAAMRVEASARQALGAMTEGDMLRTSVSALKRLFKQMPVNTAAMRRQLADEAVTRGAYIF